MLTAVRVVEMVARKRLAPILHNPHKTSVANLLRHHIFWQETQPATRDSSAQDRPTAVERPLPLDPRFQFMAILFKIPLQETSVGRQTQIDATMVRDRQVLSVRAAA